MTASRVTNGGVRLDGRLDEDLWQSAEMVSDFVQKVPVEGSIPKERTEVGFVFDDDAIYVGARMYSDHPESLRVDLNRRDNTGSSEAMIVSIDSYLDRRTCYDFGVSVAGVRTDRYHAIDNEYDRDLSYNPVWDAQSAVDSLGWTCEMRIPFSQLRFIEQEQLVWGVNMNRWIPGRNEDNFWVAVPLNQSGWSSWFGDLHGIGGVKPSSRIELLPYVASESRFTSSVDDEDPFHDGSEIDGRVGADIKMGLGPNITLDGTINPDFGQVEADPAEVNLSAFETFFDEKRPFFIEGSSLFEAEGPQYFYSRRIGAPPRGDDLAEGDFTDVPSNTTILGATKLTGRSSSGLSIGALTALTSRERARGYNAETATESKTEVEPTAGYGVVRVQQEFGEDQSTVGLILTGTARDMDKGSDLASLLRREAITGGADWTLRFNDGEYDLIGFAGFSHVAGDSTAILRTQRSSARYFQRPDANHVEVDSSKTSLTGWTAGLRGGKREGKHWLWGGGFSLESPEFEVNDLGALSSADDVDQWAHIAYRENQPGKLLRSYYLELNTSSAWNFSAIKAPSSDPSHRFSEVGLFAEGTFLNYWRAEWFNLYGFKGQSDDLTRGGPWMGTYESIYSEVELGNNFSAATQYGLNVSHFSRKSGSFENAFEVGASTRLGNRWFFSIEPRYARGREARQYIDAIEGGRPETYNSRYIFSNVDQSELSAEIRVNFFLTPNLSVEAWAEPFAASGRYYGFGKLPAPGEHDLREYGTDGTTITKTDESTYEITDGSDSFTVEAADYGVRSLRSNVVLRWEFRPGSTFYLVWQQNREGSEDPGETVTPSALGESLSADGDNFFSLKLSYWIPAS